MTTTATRLGTVAVAAAGLGVVIGHGLLAPPTAEACGGFFCSQAAPVEQSAEEIIFVQNPDDTVTAVIRIMYQGPSEKFAWVLPMAGVPTVGLSSNAAFDSLRGATDPQYFVNQTIEGECKEGDFGFPGRGVSQGGFPADAAVNGDDGGVGVLAHAEVGPYIYDVIEVDPALKDRAQKAVDWLVKNGYDVTDIGPEVLRPYLDDGLNLMAFKLQKSPDVTSGSIRPVILTYDGTLPSIPIRPTAVAARPDMGIRVWVVGSAQSVPSNYKSLVINEAIINWFDWRSTYDAVVSAAADEAAGQGFVTEMAGPSASLDQAIFGDGQQQQWVSYSLQSFVDGFDMIQQASWQYRGYDGWREAVCGAVEPLPAGVTCDDFGRNPDQFRATVQINQPKFLRLLYEGAIKPLIETQKLLLARPYVTRLYSTMSADEMDIDPVFDFNPDLADVSNQHQAEQVIECNPNVDFCSAPWRIELPQGGVIKGEGCQNQWPLGLDSGLPASLLIVATGTSGGGEVVEDNSDKVLAALFDQSGMEPTGMALPTPPTTGVPIGGEASPLMGGMKPPPGTPGDSNPASDTVVSDGGCAVRAGRSGGSPALPWLLAAAALLVRRRPMSRCTKSRT